MATLNYGLAPKTRDVRQRNSNLGRVSLKSRANESEALLESGSDSDAQTWSYASLACAIIACLIATAALITIIVYIATQPSTATPSPTPIPPTPTPTLALVLAVPIEVRQIVAPSPAQPAKREVPLEPIVIKQRTPPAVVWKPKHHHRPTRMRFAVGGKGRV